MKKLVFLLLFGLSTKALAVNQPNFDFFCRDLIKEEPVILNYSSYFTESFQKAVPLPYFKSVFSDLYSQVGACESFDVIDKGNNQYRLILHGKKKLDAQLSLFFDPTQNLFSGLLLDGVDDPSIQIHNWNDVKTSLNKFDPQGKASATLVTEDGTLELTHNNSGVFAIGSTFKLYILGALEKAISEGRHSWDEVLPLKEEWKSLPSGIMHAWPAGQEIKLSEYAEKMISISDNTATDHLLYLLGRDNVENMLEPMGNTHKKDSLPLLSSLEMFKLKWAVDPSETKAYAQKDKAGRLQMLEALKQVPRSQVGTNFVDMNQPTYVDKIEWFATTPENCKAIFWLASRNSTEIRSILSHNVPVLSGANTPSSHWAYAGYKGGSEPGVLNMTFLLESKKGTRACLAVSWNNPQKAMPRDPLMGIIKKTLEFAETLIP